MDKCISYWSMKGGLANTLPIDDALGQAKAAGFAGMELGIGPEGVLTPQSTQDDCATIREQIDKAAMVVQTVGSGMSWGANPTSDDPAVRQRGIDLHVEALKRTAWCGCEAMLVVPGVVMSPIAPDECIRYDVAVKRMREAVKVWVDTAEQVGVDLCMENVWNGLLLSPLEWIDFIDGFQSERLGMYFDVGNVLGYHQYPPHWIELLGRRIKRVHIKDYWEDFFNGKFDFSRLGEGQVPWDQTIEALQSIGYDKTIVAEMMPPGEEIVAHTSQAMDRLFNFADSGGG